MWIKITRLEEQKEQKAEICRNPTSSTFYAKQRFPSKTHSMNSIHLGREKKIRIGYGSIPIDTFLVG
jgi:hypothetical protein